MAIRLSLFFPLMIWVLGSSPSPLFSAPQETARDLNDARRVAKFLTPGEVDSWLFEAKKDETVVVSIATSEFDSVVGLAKATGKSDLILFEKDDEGSQSQFSFRITEPGSYKIRVHGFEMKGGGNYEMTVQRFVGQALEIGTPVEGRFDRKGQAHFFFNGELDENLVVSTTRSSHQEIRDPNGNSVSYDWHSSLRLKESGEYLLHLNGPREEEFSLVVRPAIRNSLVLDKPQAVDVGAESLHIWEIDAKPGEFRLITLTRAAGVDARLVFARKEMPDGKRLAEPTRFAALKYFPCSDKGSHYRYSVLFGREGRYQVQAFVSGTEGTNDGDGGVLDISNQAAKKLEIEMVDPTIRVKKSGDHGSKLTIGGDQFYGFQAKAGDLLSARLQSDRFDTVLRLYNEWGHLIEENDDSHASKNSEITTMISKDGSYRWQVASYGNGGGGDYRLELQEKQLAPLELGKVNVKEWIPKTIDYWALEGEKGRTVLIEVRSQSINPIVAIFGPSGVRIGRDDDNGIGNNSLLAVKLPSTGRYTVWVWGRENGGEYQIRVVDGDWENAK